MTLLTIEIIIKILLTIIPLLIAIAYFTLAERKIMAAIQRRSGPNVVGYAGLLQPLADGLKLIVKETTIPSSSNKFLFAVAPILTFFLSLLGWGVIPFGEGIVISDINLGIMFIFAVSSLGVYGVIIAGWASNSKYAFLGALRSAAQMISYELSMGFIIINIVILTGSFNLSDIVKMQATSWNHLPQGLMLGMFFVCCLAETNRHPFDLMEAESELVSGFNVEYSGVGFAMFFLGEYGNILLMCGLTSILFLGGWYSLMDILVLIPGPIWFGIKIVCFVILFIWVRAAFPRYRYDQLMRLGWKIFLPLAFAYLIFTSSNHVIDLTSNQLFINNSGRIFCDAPRVIGTGFTESALYKGQPPLELYEGVIEHLKGDLKLLYVASESNTEEIVKIIDSVYAFFKLNSYQRVFVFLNYSDLVILINTLTDSLIKEGFSSELVNAVKEIYLPDKHDFNLIRKFDANYNYYDSFLLKTQKLSAGTKELDALRKTFFKN